MKTITLPIHNRPDYLKQTIESLKQFDLSDFTLFVQAEPGCQENIDLINAIDFVKVELYINPRKLGVRNNPFECIDRAFNAGSTWNYHIEDDLIFAPDTIDLVNWYKDNQQDDVIIYGTCNRYGEDQTEENINKLTAFSAFSGLGWCVSKEIWTFLLREVWFLPSPLGPGKEEGWDWNVVRYFQIGSTKQMIPVVTRSTTIGVYGTYSNASSFEMFKSITLSEIKSTDEFIVKE